MSDIIRIADSFQYPDEINYLSISAMRTWQTPFLQFFAYDEITDKQIEMALSDLDNLILVDPDIDWEDDDFLAGHAGIAEKDKHAYRVAAIVMALRESPYFQSPISFDTEANSQCGFCVTNGHHRIRAAEFLGIDVVPFSLNGYVDMIEELIDLAGREETVSVLSRQTF